MTSATSRDGDGSRVLVRPKGEAPAPAPGMGNLGMTVFIAALSMLFAGSIVAVLVIRARAETWPPPGAPALPWSLWVSTLLLLGCSATAQVGLNGIRSGNQVRLRRALLSTIGLALLFVAVQGWCWIRFFHEATFRTHLYGFSFYMLTGLHALHVLGGLVLLGFVTVRAHLGAYSWAYYPGVRHNAVYWHFLDVVWIVLFAVLLITG